VGLRFGGKAKKIETKNARGAFEFQSSTGLVGGRVRLMTTYLCIDKEGAGSEVDGGREMKVEEEMEDGGERRKVEDKKFLKGVAASGWGWILEFLWLVQLPAQSRRACEKKG
jgi:hypothetical protein